MFQTLLDRPVVAPAPEVEHSVLKQPATAAQLASIRFQVLRGPEWEAAICGSYENGVTQGPWLESPKLRYYRPSYRLFQQKDTRVFFLASIPATGKGNKRRLPVALMEIAENASATEYGLKYVSVDPSFRRHGLSRKLYEMLIDELRTRKLTLYRSGRGKYTPEVFTDRVSAMLDEAGIMWTQGGPY